MSAHVPGADSADNEPDYQIIYAIVAMVFSWLSLQVPRNKANCLLWLVQAQISGTMGAYDSQTLKNYHCSV
jgi:hypothetical protein